MATRASPSPRTRPASRPKVTGSAKPARKRRARRRARTSARQKALRREQLAAARREKARRAAEVRQSEQFSKATNLFKDGKFGLAKRILERAQHGPNPSLAHRSRVYLAICLKKRARKRPILTTVDDYYHHGVRLLNDGDFNAAVRVLNRGLHKDKTAAHLHYVKAVAKVLAGQRTGALIPLKKAIALEPDIRILARGDPDLQSVINRAPFSRVVASPD